MISGSYNCTTSHLPTAPAVVGVGPTPPLSQGPPAPSIGLWKKKRMKLSVSRTSASTKGAVYTEAEAEEEGKLQLQKGIAEFYDESSGLWESIWGDHMHHGFYDPNAASTTTTDSLLSDHRSAQIRMIEEALRFAGVPGFINLASHPLLSALSSPALEVNLRPHLLWCPLRRFQLYHRPLPLRLLHHQLLHRRALHASLRHNIRLVANVESATLDDVLAHAVAVLKAVTKLAQPVDVAEKGGACA
ncbi:hypothetical protein CsSME_00042361 [Camellia sinensis var. sinensis]